MINYSLKYTISTVIWQLHDLGNIYIYTHISCYSNVATLVTSDTNFQLQIVKLN